jgi:hypothetical protein
MIEPMNCPFCGSSDVGTAGGQIHCYSCPAKLEVQNTNTFYAVELWNKRSTDSEITSLMARVAELKESSGMKANLCMEWKVANNKAQARVAQLVTALQDAVNIIQSDANTKENYGSLCRMGSVLAKDSSAAWLLRQKADVIEQCMRDIHSLRSAFNLSEDETMGIKMAVQHCKGQVKDFSLAADKREVKDFRQAADEADKAGGGL